MQCAPLSVAGASKRHAEVTQLALITLEGQRLNAYQRVGQLEAW